MTNISWLARNFKSWKAIEEFHETISDYVPEAKLGAIGLLDGDFACIFYIGEKDGQYYKLVEKLEKGLSDD